MIAVGGMAQVKDAISREVEPGFNVEQSRSQVQIGLRLIDSACDPKEPLLELLPDRVIQRLPRVFRDTFAREFTEVVVAQGRAAGAGDGVFRQLTIEKQIVQGWKELPPREIAGAPENNEGARLRRKGMGHL